MEDNQKMEKINHMNTYILIDRSGSMLSRWGETLNAVNAYAEELRKSETRMTVATFDEFQSVANRKVLEVLRDRDPVSEWIPLTNRDASPRGMTPLFDAIGELSSLINKDQPARATIMILTDGEENSSKTWNKSTAGELISSWKSRGYDVVFVGADFNAMQEASKVGVAFGATLNMSAGNYEAAFRGMASRTMAYASSGEVVNFTDEDRAVATGKK